jgi:hypothetical protein
MTHRYGGTLAFLAAALLAGLATSCAATKNDVDATPTARLKIDAHVGKGFSSDSTNIVNISDDFRPNETVYAIVDVPGKTEGMLRVRWVYGGDTIDERTMAIQEGVNVYPFRLTPPAEGLKVGDYRFEVFVNDNPSDSETFHVKV